MFRFKLRAEIEPSGSSIYYFHEHSRKAYLLHVLEVRCEVPVLTPRVHHMTAELLKKVIPFLVPRDFNEPIAK